jgi:tetratricopeptide (TPR) repeat protein
MTNWSEESQSYIEFKKGLHWLKCNQEREAHKCFNQALIHDPDDHLLPAVKSYLGYTLATVEGREISGVRLMREALNQDITRADFFTNLGKVYLNVIYDRKRAIYVLHRALKYCPRDPELHDLIRKLGIRRTPLLSFLSRHHFLNRFLGKYIFKSKPRNRLR